MQWKPKIPRKGLDKFVKVRPTGNIKLVSSDPAFASGSLYIANCQNLGIQGKDYSFLVFYLGNNFSIPGRNF